MFGGALLGQLRSNPAVSVRAMVRRQGTQDHSAGNVTFVEADLDDPSSLPAALSGVTDVFLCTPMDDRITARECGLVDALRAANPDARVMTIAGAVDHDGDPLSESHLEAIRYLQQSGLRWTILSPNSVMETALLPQASTVPWGLVFGMSGQGRIGLVALDDVARVAAAALTTDGFDGQELVVTGPEALSMPQVCSLLSAELGRPVRFLDLPEDRFTAMLIRDGSYGDLNRLETEVLCHLRAWRRDGANRVTDTVQRVTGQPPMGLARWLQVHRDAFDQAPGFGGRLMGLLARLQYGRYVLAG
jgi:uncharacterized protein YbjT (DUF2867 family)